MAAFITSIGTAVPKHKISQEEIAEFMSLNLDLKGRQQRELEVLYRATGIQSRYSVLEDYTKPSGYFDFFSNESFLESFPSVSARMDAYRKEALPLSLEAIAAGTIVDRDFTHLITVSCTGMYAPGLDFDLVRTLELSSSIKRTAINFMGCYGAFNALKMADDICRARSKSKVLIVCVELCSLHFQKEMDKDTLLANALFGDGAAALVVEGIHGKGMNLKIENFHCALIPEGNKDMTWGIGDFGFEMTLSSYVPTLIKKGIGDLVASLLTEMGAGLADVSHFAIHPGGKKILEGVEQELGLEKNQNRHAYEVLKNYGNMSSPTVVFVLQHLLSELSDRDKGSKVMAMAFGPGLTLESMLLKVD